MCFSDHSLLHQKVWQGIWRWYNSNNVSIQFFPCLTKAYIYFLELSLKYKYLWHHILALNIPRETVGNKKCVQRQMSQDSNQPNRCKSNIKMSLEKKVYNQSCSMFSLLWFIVQVGWSRTLLPLVGKLVSYVRKDIG